jgi:hypothetical protein
MAKLLTPETAHKQYQCGKKNRNVKLTEEKVRLIKMLLKKGNTQRSIAEVFKVSEAAINMINTGRTWRWVE